MGIALTFVLVCSNLLSHCSEILFHQGQDCLFHCCWPTFVTIVGFNAGYAYGVLTLEYSSPDRCKLYPAGTCEALPTKRTSFIHCRRAGAGHLVRAFAFSPASIRNMETNPDRLGEPSLPWTNFFLQILLTAPSAFVGLGLMLCLMNSSVKNKEIKLWVIYLCLSSVAFYQQYSPGPVSGQLSSRDLQKWKPPSAWLAVIFVLVLAGD
jgi:hypothetical protein